MVRFSLACTLAPPLVRLRGRLSSPKSRGAFPPSSQEIVVPAVSVSPSSPSFALTRRSLSPLFRTPGVLYTPSQHHHHIHSSALIGLCPQVQHNNTHSLLSIAEYLHFRRPKSPDHITYQNQTTFKNSCLPRSLLDDQSASLKH